MKVLVVNPNASVEVTRAIARALAPVGPCFKVVRRAAGPDTIRTDEDVAEAAEAFARIAATNTADGYITACFSDPGLDLARSRLPQPVVGAQEAAVLEACGRAERFGIIALSPTAIPRHLRRIEALGVLDRLVAELPLNNVSAAGSGNDPEVFDHMLSLAKELQDGGAGAIVLGCAGMAVRAAELESALGLPVIEPVAAAGRTMLARLGNPRFPPKE